MTTTSRDLPLVTVLTPTYNRHNFLRATLASVRAQTYPNIEHIVLDGGSTDDSIALLARAQDRWGVRWVSGRDGGMYEAINKGLDLASGSIVGWVNSDDWLLPWTVETVVESMLADPNTPHAVYGDVISVSGDDDHASFHVYSEFRREVLAAGSTLAQPTVFWPTAATAEAGPLDTATYRQIADCEYWLRLSTVLPFVKLREFQAVVQNHPDTKRQSLKEQIEREFATLVGSYNRRPWPRLTRRRNVMAERVEWVRLLCRQGWRRAYDSPLLDLSWQEQGLGRLRQSGPWRRHPLAGEFISIAPLRRHLEVLERDLG